MRISDWSSDVCSSDLHSLGTRIDTLGGWLSLLGRVGGPANPDFVDWLAVDRYDGREFDCGLHRHWLDPARPIAEIVYRPAQGVLVTSATLRGSGHSGHSRGGWADADIRTGARHMRSEEHTSELQSLMRNSYAVLCLKKQTKNKK